MSEPAFVELIVLVGVAIGLVLLGLSKALLGGRGTAARVAGATGAILVPAALPGAFGFPQSAPVASGVVAVAVLGAAAIGSSWARGVVSTVAHRLARPAVQSGLLAMGGGLLLVGALARYDLDAEAQLESDMAFMVQVTWKPPLHEVESITTASGHRVGLYQVQEMRSPSESTAAERPILTGLGFSERVIRVGPACDNCNCHGWVFTGGRYWVGGEDVDHILTDNGYQPVSQPRAGDVVIYRESQRITHTAVVRTAEPGGPVLVEGKWGWMGVFLHPPEGSCYGRQFTYYRGPRTTHVLAGVGGSPAARPNEAAGPLGVPTTTNAVGSE